MRYLLRAALAGAVTIAAVPASAAVIASGGTADVKALWTGDQDKAEGAVPEALAAAQTPARFPIVPAREADDDVATLPEPASWGLMFLGFGGLSFALRRRAGAEQRIRFS